MAIGLGLGLGFLAFVLLVVLFWSLWRRRRRTGDYFRGRTPTPEPDNARDSQTDAKSSPDEAAYISPGVVKDEDEGIEAPMSTYLNPRPAFLNPSLRQGSQATSYDQPFYTPAEGRSFSFNYSDDGEQDEQDTRVADLPPSLPPIPAQWQGLDLHPQDGDSHRQNPFSEDNSIQDVGLGYVTTNDDEMRPIPEPVHYPSNAEVDRFDFTDAGKKPLNPQSEDDWFAKEGKYGRHELP